MTETFTLEETFDQPVRLDRGSKRAAIDAELSANPDRSDSAIARVVGCDHKTVGSRRRESANSQQGNSNSPAVIAEGRDLAIAKARVSLAPGDEADFFAADCEDLVIPHQPAIAVYENQSGAISIRQRVDYEDDAVITVRPENVERLVKRLRDLAEQIGG